MSETRRGGGSYLTLTVSCQVKMRKSILWWFADMVSLGVRIITTTRILGLITWFLWFIYYLFCLGAQAHFHHSKAQQGSRGFLERSWQLEYLLTALKEWIYSSLVLWRWHSGGIAAVWGTWWPAYKASSDFFLWQIARVHPPPHCLFFYMHTSNNVKLHMCTCREHTPKKLLMLPHSRTVPCKTM